MYYQHFGEISPKFLNLGPLLKNLGPENPKPTCLQVASLELVPFRAQVLPGSTHSLPLPGVSPRPKVEYEELSPSLALLIFSRLACFTHWRYLLCRHLNFTPRANLWYELIYFQMDAESDCSLPHSLAHIYTSPSLLIVTTSRHRARACFASNSLSFE